MKFFNFNVQKKAYLFIGSDNQSKKLEKEKIERILNKHFEGYSASQIVGYWKGTREKTLKVEVITDKPKSYLKSVAEELKTGLNQESVLLEITKSDCNFI